MEILKSIAPQMSTQSLEDLLKQHNGSLDDTADTLLKQSNLSQQHTSLMNDITDLAKSYDGKACYIYLSEYCPNTRTQAFASDRTG